MPVGPTYLQSLTSPTVHRIRASNDYTTDVNQWRIGRSSILIWSLGLWPFKDTFWTYPDMPGNTYNFTEPNSALNAAISVLSAAGVAIGDKIGRTDQALINATCMTDGTILNPDRPATAIDRTWLNLDSNRITGEVYSTSATIGHLTWFFVLTSNVSKPFNLLASDIGAENHVKYWVHDWTQPKVQPELLSAPLRFQVPMSKASPNGKSPFNLFTFSPIHVLGERSKLVSVSKSRFIEITNSHAKVRVCAGEEIEISLAEGKQVYYKNNREHQAIVDIQF